ncbi:unnamed protein product [Heterotrigona itama]|uniref:C2H2-type domain-containing protein n=1 Tax=Heterotrigona itama TaxID=395501 RepID=A0A6V7H9Y9_9HYME|nr:unnamed protein product [Heterotrigona itama]
MRSLLTDEHSVSSLFSSTKADGEEHRKSAIQKTAGDSQVHQVWKGLSIGNLATKTPKTRMWGLLVTMLLSQDVQRPQDNSEAWRQLPYPGMPYDPNRSQRRKDAKDTGVLSKSEWINLNDYRSGSVDDSLPKERNYNDAYYYPCPVLDPNKKQPLQQQQQQLFTCALCGREYTWMYSLRRHQLQCGNKEARNKCHFCSRKFYRHGSDLMNEFEAFESKDIKLIPEIIRAPLVSSMQHYFCGECGKGYKWMANLRRHQRLECGKLPKHRKRADLSDWFVKQENEYEEPQTLFEFVASSYDLAERKKAAKTVICEECGKSFSRLDSLRRHEKNYCRVKGDRMYCREKSENYSEKDQEDDAEVCEISFHGQLPMNYLLCDSSILNSVETGMLRKNVKSHQQFRCDGCDRAYTRMDSLKRHQAKCDASLEKLQEEVEWLHRQKFYCNQCGKGYKRLDTLRRHQRLVCGDKESASTATDKSATQ